MEYEYISTTTGNEFRAMLILNIKMGFNITGTFLNRKGKLRISMEKSL